MEEQKRPALKLVGVTENKRPPLNLITDLEKKKSGIESPIGGQPLNSGSNLFQSSVNTKQPSVLTDKGLQSYRPTKYIKPAAKPKNLQEAVDDDNNYLGAVYNQLISSGSDFVGGMTRLIAKSNPYNTPILANSADQLAEKSTSSTESLRTNSSSKKYEEGLQSGFDLSNGFSMDDVKSLPLMISRFAADVGLSIPTGGASFIAQGYSQGLKEYDKATEGQEVNQDTRDLFGMGYSLINGAADMISIGAIMKNPIAAKGVKKLIFGKAIQELAKHEGKITADVIEQSFTKIVKQSFNKIKTVGIKAASSAAIEGSTEAGQGGLSDALKLLTNKLSDKDVFNKQEVTEDFLKNRLNDFGGGAVMGSVLGGITHGLKSSDDYIAERVAQSATLQELEGIKADLALEVENGTMDAGRAEILISSVDRYVQASSKLPKDLSAKQRKKALEAVIKRDEVNAIIKQTQEQSKSADEALAPQTQQEIDLLEAKKASLNDNVVEATTDEKFTYSVDPETGKWYKQLGEDGQPEEITKQQYELEKQVTPKEIINNKDTPELIPEQTIPNSENGLSIDEINKIPKGELHQDISKLREGISKEGIKEPIVLKYYAKDNAVRVLEGHHRIAAANELGIKNIPIKIIVEWDGSIKDGNADIGGQVFNPPKKLDISEYNKRNYYPTNIDPGEIGYSINKEQANNPPTFEQPAENKTNDNNLDTQPKDAILDGENTTGTTTIDSATQTDTGAGTTNEATNSGDISGVGDKVVGSEVVLQKAETDLYALKQVTDKVKKYEGSIKRLTEAKNAGQISDTEFNATKERFDDVMADYTPKGAKSTNVGEAIPDQVVSEDPEIEGEVKKPSAEKLAELKAKQAEVKKRIRAKSAQLSSGFNPDAISDLVELGALYIQEGLIRFSDFADRLKAEYGQEIPPSVIKDVYEKSAEKNGLGIRKFPESVQNSELSDQVKDAVQDSSTPYNKQVMADMEARVDALPETERIAAVAGLSSQTDGLEGENNFAVLAGISLMNEYNAAGEIGKAEKIAEMLSRSATVIAQTLRQFGQLRKSSAASFVQFVQKQLGEKGRKLTDAEKKRITELFEAQKALFQEMETAQEAYLVDLAKNEKIKYYSAMGAYDVATRELETLLESLLPKVFSDTVSSVLKGNLLTFKSLVANPIYNILYAPFRFARGEIANVADLAISKTSSVPRTKISSLSLDALRVAWYSIGMGSRSAYKKMIKGGSGGDLAKYDVDRRLKPLEAWKRIWDLDEWRNRKAKESLSDVVEGTFGWSANLMFRLLPWGDDMFFEIAKNHRLLEIAKTRGLSGKDITRFIIKPDEASLKSGIEYGKKATFQDNNILSSGAIAGLKHLEEHMAGIHPVLGGAVKMLTSASFPFIKTPSSVALKIVNYATPIIPSVKALLESSKAADSKAAYKKNPSAFNADRLAKHQRLATEAIADVAISVAITSAASLIVANGLVTSSAPDEKERKKERDFMYATQPPLSINISGLKRLMSGEDPTYQSGDVTQSLAVYGIAGAVFGIVNDTKGGELRDQALRAKKKGLGGKPFYPESQDDTFGKFFKDILIDGASTLPASVKYLTEQSFLQGVESLMGALSKGEYEQWYTQLYRTALSIPVPNSFVQLNKVWRENMKNPYTEDQWQTFANIADERIGSAEDLPTRLNIWGEPVKQTPTGANEFVYQAIDPFRTQSILTDPTTLKVFDIFRKTQDTGAIPPSVDREIVLFGEKRKLTKDEYQQLSEFVGKQRKILVDIVLKNYDPKSTDKLQYQVDLLKNAYEQGNKIGKAMFFAKNNHLLK